MGTINPLQQQTHITYSFSLYRTPQTLCASIPKGSCWRLVMITGSHLLCLWGLAQWLCDPVSKLNEGSPSLLFLYDFLIPFSDFMSRWSLTLRGGAAVNTARPKNVLLFWACSGMGIKHPGWVRDRVRELWIYKCLSLNYYEEHTGSAEKQSEKIHVSRRTISNQSFKIAFIGKSLSLSLTRAVLHRLAQVQKYRYSVYSIHIYTEACRLQRYCDGSPHTWFKVNCSTYGSKSTGQSRAPFTVT